MTEFKNFERLRYRISKDINEVAIKNKNSSNDIRKEVINTIFATIFSAAVTEIAFRGTETVVSWCSILRLVALFIVVYIITYVLHNFLYQKWIKFWELRKIHHVDKSLGAMLQKQKDFDNIACDSILVARDFKLAFESLEQHQGDENIKTFYLFEIMHYLRVACDKTMDLIDNKEKCIRTMDVAEGVDDFRVKNIINIMQELQIFLGGKLSGLKSDAEQEKAIEYQYSLIEKKIEKIKSSM